LRQPLTGKGMQSLREGSLAETSGSGSLRELEPGPRGNFGDSSALSRRKSASEREKNMAVNKPTGDNARKGAVKKRSQTKSTLGGTSAWTKRNRNSGEFMALTARQKEEGCEEIQRRAGGKVGRENPNGEQKNCREEEIASRSRALDTGAQERADMIRLC